MAKAEIWAIFPESWRLTQRMCLLFAQVTRTHLAEILDSKVRSLRLSRPRLTLKSPSCVVPPRMPCVKVLHSWTGDVLHAVSVLYCSWDPKRPLQLWQGA